LMQPPKTALENMVNGASKSQRTKNKSYHIKLYFFSI
jgi:hypothetical protein